jgi:hypothetical protein
MATLQHNMKKLKQTSHTGTLFLDVTIQRLHRSEGDHIGFLCFAKEVANIFDFLPGSSNKQTYRPILLQNSAVAADQGMDMELWSNSSLSVSLNIAGSRGV